MVRNRSGELLVLSTDLVFHRQTGEERSRGLGPSRAPTQLTPQAEMICFHHGTWEQMLDRNLHAPGNTGILFLGEEKQIPFPLINPSLKCLQNMFVDWI
jgi:hypothetical protein